MAGRIARGLGLVAGVAALAAGGIAARARTRAAHRRQAHLPAGQRGAARTSSRSALTGPRSSRQTAWFCIPRSTRWRPSRRPDPGLRPRLRPEPGLLALPARALPGYRQVFYDQRSHGRSTRSAGSCAGFRSWPMICAGPGRGGGRRPGGPGRSLDGRHDDHAAGPDPAGAVRARQSGGSRSSPPRPARWPTTHRSAACPGGPSPGRRADDGRAQPHPRARRARPAGAAVDLGYVVTRRIAFGSDVPASYVEFVSEMLARPRWR